MADLSITAGNVIAGADSKQESGVSGEAIVAGKAVYLDPTTKKYMLADSDSATAAVRKMRGIALNGASLNQPMTIHKSGDITIGGTMTAGLAYYLSKTAGGLCLVADIAAGGYATVVGVAKSTTVLDVNITESGVAV